MQTVRVITHSGRRKKVWKEIKSSYHSITRRWRNSPDIVLDPKKTALLIVDMQNEFCPARFWREALMFKENRRMGSLDSVP